MGLRSRRASAPSTSKPPRTSLRFAAKTIRSVRELLLELKSLVIESIQYVLRTNQEPFDKG